MRIADVFFQNILAGQFLEFEGEIGYRFQYIQDYCGPPISLTMPVQNDVYEYQHFPPFFDGLLPEGFQLEALLRQRKLDREDKFGQLLQVGADTIGAVTIIEHAPDNVDL